MSKAAHVVVFGLVALTVGCDVGNSDASDAGFVHLEAATPVRPEDDTEEPAREAAAPADDTSDDEAEDDNSEADETRCSEEDLEIVVEADGTVRVTCEGIDIRVEPPASQDDDESDGDDEDEDDELPPDDEDDSDESDDELPTDDDTDTETQPGTDTDTDTDTDGTDTLPVEDSGTPPPQTGLCRPVDALERMPARLSVVSSDVIETEPEGVFVSDVFDRFNAFCGACHVQFSLGNYQVTASTFTDLVTRSVIQEVMGTSDRAKVMPPGDLLLSERPAGDPVRELYDLLIQWRTAVDPILQADPNADPQVFFPPEDTTTDPTVSPFLLSPEQGAAITNLGTCIPDPALVNTETTKSVELDAKFAAMTKLPRTLQETDLITLDSRDLARHGVISYAPTYPLFSDDSGKMRHVRVPRGTSVHFDAGSQTFEMPENTRFYKTFLKPVTEAGGHVGWRKIETRIIVSRQDELMPDGTRKPRALAGTYKWDSTETEAILVEDPLNNGKPFRDVTFRYLVDEEHGAALQAQAPLDLDEQLMEKGWARNYGIPSSQRCVDCHRGSENHSFVLGFGPLQVNRLPMDDTPDDGIRQQLHGIYDAPSPDDLTQLQRLIDYGVITGISDPSEVWPLELTQELPPRNDYELRVQGYMVGNCAICHNPDGLASFENPVLRDILDMYPDADGGIFGFPLTGDEAFSPRIRRGAGGELRIPYVSPDMLDRPPASRKPEESSKHGLLSPWRSLIFRNVDTPFTYVDDGALFPKMPFHVAGFDPRLPKMVGEWMASIPARQIAKSDEERYTFDQTYEEVFEGESDYEAALTAAEERVEAYRKGGRYNCVEYQSCVDENGNDCAPQYPCVDTRDIVAQEVINAIRINSPNLVPQVRRDGIPARPHWVNTDLTEPPLEVWQPRRPDWPTVLLCGNRRLDRGDPSTPADDEQCDDGPEGSETCTRTCKAIPCASTTITPEQQAECERTPTHSTPEAFAVQALREMKVTEEFLELALGERPMTFWEEKRECDLDDEPTPDSYEGSAPARWMDLPEHSQRRSSPLYMQSPGEAIFTSICANCHGPNADSQGRQAATVALMSGGQTRVANLRDGLLQPENTEAVFGVWADQTRTERDLAARYVSWMALGGTQRHIPAPVLDLVAATLIYGEKREGLRAIASPNMLELGVLLCESLLGITEAGDPPNFVLERGALQSFDSLNKNIGRTPLIGWTGDFETWRDVCTFDNAPPVMVLTDLKGLWSALSEFRMAGLLRRTSREGRPLYCDECDPTYVPEGPPPPVDTLFPYEGVLQYIGDHQGKSEPVQVGNINPANKQPWCMMHPSDPSNVLTNPPLDQQLTAATQFAQAWELAHPEQRFPWCPPSLLGRIGTSYANAISTEERFVWSRRGAVNAGMAVYAYLNAVGAGLPPKPAYNRCEERE